MEALEVSLEPPLTCYPYPNLTRTGRRFERPLRMAILENQWLRVVVAIDLGGRIWQIENLESGRKAFPESSGDLQTLGPRGAWLERGLQWELGHEFRATSLGPLDYSIYEASGAAAVFLRDAVREAGLSVAITLPSDRAEILLEFVRSNRGLGFAAGHFGVRFGGEARLLGPGIQTRGELPLFVRPEPYGFERFAEGPIARLVCDENVDLRPGEVRQTKVTLQPFDFPDASGAIGPAVWRLESERLLISCALETGAAIHLVARDGSTYQGSCDLRPGQTHESPLHGLAGSIEKAAVLCDERPLEPPLRLDESASSERAPSSAARELVAEAYRATLLGEDATHAIALLAKQPGYEAAARAFEGARLLAQNEPQAAAERFEQALMTNAYQPWLWWLAALASRPSTPQDARPALENAHFLAPLEPLLRVEAFLSQPVAEGKDTSPLMRDWADRPDLYVEGIGWLLFLGRDEDAIRLADEALRAARTPLILYLLAWAYLRRNRMQVEAANLVSEASQAPISAPLPFREVEKVALFDLSARFPNDARLAEWASLTS